MIYELHSSDGKVIEIPEENRTRKEYRMTKERAIEILISVAKTFLKDNMPTGVLKLLLSDHQLKKVYDIQEAIKVLETETSEQTVTKIEHANGNRVVIDTDKMILYQPDGREFIFQIPKPILSKPS